LTATGGVILDDPWNWYEWTALAGLGLFSVWAVWAATRKQGPVWLVVDLVGDLLLAMISLLDLFKSDD